MMPSEVLGTSLVYLVGSDFQHGFSCLTGSPGAQPFENSGFRNTFAHSWHYQVNNAIADYQFRIVNVDLLTVKRPK